MNTCAKMKKRDILDFVPDADTRGAEKLQC